MKKVGIVFLILALFICFVSPAHVITTSIGGSSYSVNENINVLYNITVNNTDIGQTANITQINITLPSNFTFETNSQGTDALSADFANIDTILTWADFEDYIINGSEWKYFWFKANASLGDYNFVITTINTTGTYNSNIAVEVKACFPNWTCNTWSLCENYLQTRKCADENNCNNETDKPTESQSCSMLCTPNWNCTKWSECVGETQIRSCVDFNNCGNNSEKPEETKQCITCTPNWTCTKWSECADSAQTRICTDSNNCGIEQGKPTETKTYALESDFSWLFIAIVIVVIIMIIGNVILIKRELVKQTKRGLIKQKEIISKGRFIN